eukprot:GHVL01016063.1.p1 GENE.GHVL01016063.1~~GHVL01016063.1.p1  ORF type:complete len:167 (+),score=59.59 GHVL01016063.1:35-502(+)
MENIEVNDVVSEEDDILNFSDFSPDWVKIGSTIAIIVVSLIIFYYLKNKRMKSAETSAREKMEAVRSKYLERLEKESEAFMKTEAYQKILEDEKIRSSSVIEAIRHNKKKNPPGGGQTPTIEEDRPGLMQSSFTAPTYRPVRKITGRKGGGGGGG